MMQALVLLILAVLLITGVVWFNRGLARAIFRWFRLWARLALWAGAVCFALGKALDCAALNFVECFCDADRRMLSDVSPWAAKGEIEGARRGAQR